MLLSLLLLGTGPRPAGAFYLPGLAPVNFCTEEKKSDECKVGGAAFREAGGGLPRRAAFWRVCRSSGAPPGPRTPAA